jgi:hypothetical protein
MVKSRYAAFAVFIGVLAVLALVVGTRWSPANAGYIDEPAGVLEDCRTGGFIPFGETYNYVEFHPGSDASKCLLKTGLPFYAKDGLDDLPGKVVEQAYVRTVDSEGNPVDGPYTICFSSPGSLYQYRFGSGWVLINWDTNPGALVCADSAGEGVFAFVR